jgi:MFS family permease
MKKRRGRRQSEHTSAREGVQSLTTKEDARAASDAATQADSDELVESDGGAIPDAAANRRSVRAFLIGAVQAAFIIPFLFYIHFGEIDAYALSFTAFIVVLCLLVALGYSVSDRPESQTRAALRGGPFDYVGAFWLVACAFGPFFGWLVTAAFTLTEENWRWRYVVRALLCVALPVLTALPLFVYVRGRYWHVALLLLLGVTALPVWSSVNTLRDLREGPEVRRTTGYYDAPKNSFYPAADGRAFKLTTLAHTQRNIKIEPAPPDVGND